MTLSEWCTAKVWNNGEPVQCSAGPISVIAASATAVLALLIASLT